MSEVVISEVTKHFAQVVALNGVSLTIPTGQIVALLGPSGCGKTTLLRCVAGLEDPTSGEISIGGKTIYSRGFSVPPEKRNIGMVFQSYALWPNMTVLRNVAYPLEIQKVGKKERNDAVMEALRLVGLEGLQDRYPGELSGGQQQRVAVARAITSRPSVLLLDEPLSNLDAKIREQVRVELREVLTRLGITSIYVTHDQNEAMAVSDRIVVMNQGNVMQDGGAEELYRRPVNRFVANFLGVSNFVDVTVNGAVDGPMVAAQTDGGVVVAVRGDTSWHEHEIDGAAVLVIRPEDVRICDESAPAAEGSNTWKGTVENRIYLGSRTDYWVKIGDIVLRAESTNHLPQIGDDVVVSVAPEAITPLPAADP